MKYPVDFLRPETPPLRGWLILALGTAASIAMMYLDRHYEWARTTSQRTAQARLEQDRLQRRPAPVPPLTPSELRLRQADADSHAPWLATLRTIEALSQEPVYLRSLSIEPAAGAIKLEAEAPSFAEALAYSESLAQAPATQPALLTSHEQIVDVVSGKSSVRFHVVAKWNAR